MRNRIAIIRNLGNDTVEIRLNGSLVKKYDSPWLDHGSGESMEIDLRDLEVPLNNCILCLYVTDPVDEVEIE